MKRGILATSGRRRSGGSSVDAYATAVQADSPLGYWRLNDASGTTMTATVGTNGSYVGTPTLGATGVLTGSTDKAVTFNGTSQAASAAINLSATPIVTLEFWLNWTSFTNNDDLAFEYTADYNTNFGFIVDPNTGGSGASAGSFEFGWSSGSGLGRTHYFARPSAGAWHHYVLVFDRTNNTNKAYVDGVLQTLTANATFATGGSFANSTLYFMSRATTSLFGQGTLDEVAIYAGELSSARVTAHYTAATGAAPADGWTNVINSDFAVDGVLPAPWQPYAFANSYEPGGYYLASHVVVSGGVLSLVQKYETSGPARSASYTSTGAGWYQGTIYASGGVADSIDHRTTTRMRVVSVGGVHSHRNMPLWWPISQNWPVDGEEDFFEGDGLGQSNAYFHYGVSNSFVSLAWPATLDVSQWHTYRMQRLNHRITIWIDDMVTPVLDQQYTATELVNTVKYPVFQQENAAYTPPTGTTGSEEIQFDWIQIDTPTP